ncbi:hypothetical protein TYRP_012108 [Tyrophagus putrescentiae]|nr:hypothetical protein TYRP_012108 [Tyrophagus putrescentiae]
MSTQQRIEFSSRWEVNRFVSVLSDKSNHIVPPFIVSPNISPFSRRLLDAYIELSVDDFSAQSSWSKISTFVNFKSYFCQPISVSFNITFRGPHYQDKITSYEHQVMLHKCGRIGLESPLLRLSVNQVAFNGTNLFVPDKLGIICKVKLEIANPHQQFVFVGSEAKPYANQVDRAAQLAIFSETFSSTFEGQEFSLTLWPNGHRKSVGGGVGGGSNQKEIAVHLSNGEFGGGDMKVVQWRIWFLGGRQKAARTIFTYASNNIVGANHLSAALLSHVLLVDRQTGRSTLPDDTLNIFIEGHVIAAHRSESIIQHFLNERSDSAFNGLTIATATLTHQWTIEALSELFAPERKESRAASPLLVSSIFTPSSLKVSGDGAKQGGKKEESLLQFHLALLPDKVVDASNEHMSLFLRCDNPPEVETFLQAKVYLMDAKRGKAGKVIQLFRKLESVITSVDMLEFISIRDFLKDDKLIICFEGEILQGKNLSQNDYYNNLAIFECKELLPIERYSSFSRLNLAPAVIKFTHKWTIDEYHKVCQKKATSLESHFAPERGIKEQLQLAVILYPFGFEEDGNNYLSILLHLKSFARSSANIQYRFAILNGKGEKVMVKENVNLFDTSLKKVTFGFKEFVAVGKLFSQKNELLPDMNLTIYCEGEVILENGTGSKADEIARLNNYHQIFITAKTPVVDCIDTDNTNLFEDESEAARKRSLKLHKELMLGKVDLEEDLLKQYRGDAKIFYFSTTNNNNNNFSNAQLYGSVLNVDSEVQVTKGIKCLNEIRTDTYKVESQSSSPAVEAKDKDKNTTSASVE